MRERNLIALSIITPSRHAVRDLPNCDPVMILTMPALETARLHLRPFQPDDLKAVAAWEPAVDAADFLAFCFRSYKEWGLGPWAMLLKPIGSLVGNCSFCRIGYERMADALEHCGEINYYVAPAHRRQGLATEALQSMLQFGFTTLRLTRIQGRCPPQNAASDRVLQKAGLKFERMISRDAHGGGLAEEDKLYAIVREDFRL